MYKKTFSANVINALEQNKCNADQLKTFMFDYLNGNQVTKADGSIMSKAEMNDRINGVFFSILGIDKTNGVSARDIYRAMRDPHSVYQCFEVMEDILDVQIEKGFRDDDFMTQFVDRKVIANGDRQDFWTNDDAIITVSKVAGTHHDVSLQRLGTGHSYTIPTSVYGAAVGAAFKRVLSGEEDFADLINAVSRAFNQKVLAEMYTEVMALDKSVPSALKGTGDLDADKLDLLIENVETANDSSVTLFGTHVALAHLNKIADIQWAPNSQKEDMARLGRLGNWHGRNLFEIPQRFPENVTFDGAFNDIKRLIDDKTILLIPNNSDKFVKMVDVGETTVYEVTEDGKAGGRIDGLRDYEVQRSFGVGIQTGRYHGAWTLA